MNVELGISTGFTIKRWPDPKDWTKVVKDELGLGAVQFSFDQFDPRGKKESVASYCYRVRNECEKQNIKIHSSFAGLSIYSHNLLYHPLVEGRIDGLDWFEHALKMTKTLGLQATGGPFGGMDMATFHSAKKRDYMEESALDLLANVLVSAKQQYDIQEYYWEPTPVMREGTVTIQDTKAFVDEINEKVGEEGAHFSLCFDIGHTTNPVLSDVDGNPMNWIRELNEDISMIHLQQTDGHLDRHFPFTETYNHRGVIDADEVLASLSELPEKRHHLYLEIGHPFEEDDAHVLQELKESVDYWRNALHKKGWKDE